MYKPVFINIIHIWAPAVSPWLWAESRTGGELHGPRQHPQNVFILNVSCRITYLNPVYGGVFAQPRSALFLAWMHYGKGKDSRLRPKRSVLNGTQVTAEGMKPNPILAWKQTKSGVAAQKERCLQEPSSCPDGARRGQSLPERSSDLKQRVAGSNCRNKVILISGIITIMSDQFCIEQSASESDGTFCSCYW